VYCPECGEIIVSTLLNQETSLVLHRLFRHQPVLAAVLTAASGIAITQLVRKFIN